MPQTQLIKNEVISFQLHYTAVRDTAIESLSESTFYIVVGIAFYVAFYFILRGASVQREEDFNYELKWTHCGFSVSLEGGEEDKKGPNFLPNLAFHQQQQ